MNIMKDAKYITNKCYIVNIVRFLE